MAMSGLTTPTLPETGPPRWAATLGYIGAFILGGVLLFGAYAKVIDPVAFAGLISREGLDFLLPSGAVVFIALTLEIGLGIALMLNIRRTPVLIASSLLVAFFLLHTGYSYYQSVHDPQAVTESCGCFGNLVERSPAEAFWQDLALLLPSCLLSWLGRPRIEDETPMWKMATTAGLTVAGLAFTWVAPSLPLDDIATRLSPGVNLAELCAGTGEDRTCLPEALPDVADDPEFPDEYAIIVIAEPLDESIQEPLNTYALAFMDGTVAPPLVVVTAMPQDEIDALPNSVLAPQFTVSHVPGVLLRPMYRAMPRSFLVKDGIVQETVTGLPPFERWGALGLETE